MASGKEILISNLDNIFLYNAASGKIHHSFHPVNDIKDYINKGGNFKNTISRNRTFPSNFNTSSKQCQGKVYVGFTVHKDGSITDAEIIKGLSEKCNEEALQHVRNAPKWDPVPRPVKRVLPITFKHPEQ